MKLSMMFVLLSRLLVDCPDVGLIKRFQGFILLSLAGADSGNMRAPKSTWNYLAQAPENLAIVLRCKDVADLDNSSSALRETAG